MDDGHWERVCELVGLALDVSPAERQQFLESSDFPPSIRAEAASLLRSHRDATSVSFLSGDVVTSGLAIEVRSPWIGREIGPYRVLRELGHGGMGVVLLAQRADALYERQVAIKIVRADLGGDIFLRRFRKEIRILAAFDHAAIARLLDAGVTDDGFPYLVMEYVDGIAIDQFCREHQCDVPTILKLFEEVVDAVSYAHSQHVVHRDIKPGNILVNANGRPKLLDFGIAKLLSERPEDGAAQTELRAWTPAYASPEQVSGAEITSSSDVYSLGALLYTLLTGDRPYQFEGLTPLQIERTFETTRPVAPSCIRVGSGRPRPMLTATDPVVLKALEPRPADRYSSAAEFAGDLVRLQNGEPPLARMAGPLELATRWCRRQGRTLAFASVTILAVAVSGVAWHRARTASAQAAAPGFNVRPSIAVLPFRQAGSENESSWVAAAASEVLSTELAAGDRVRVARAEDVSEAERDLHLAAPASDVPEASLRRLAQNVDARYVVSGVFDTEKVPDGGARDLRFDVALYDADARRVLSRRTFRGSDQQISTVAGQIAQSLLATMGVDPQQVVLEASRMLPQNPEAVRWYAEGRRHLRELDYVAAKPALERAVTAEDGSALIHTALAETWDGLGYSKRAEAEANRAVQLSTALPKRARLSVEGELRELQSDWPKAVEIYGTLHEFFPDDLDYGLHLARDQALANQPDQALAVVAELEKLPSPFDGDPRVPLTGAWIAERSSRAKVEMNYADRAFQLARARGAAQATAEALLAQANALHHAGRNFEAAKLARQAEESFARSGDSRGEAMALTAIGNFEDNLGNYAPANSAYLRAVDLFRSVGYNRGLAATLNGLGNVADTLGDREKALHFYEQSLELNRQLDDQRRVASNLNNIALVEDDLHHIERAHDLYVQSYEGYRSIGDRGGMAQVQGNIASLLRRQGRVGEARRSDEEQLAIYTDLGLTQSMIYAVQGLGHDALLEGDLPRARHFYAQAVNYSKSQGNQEQMIYGLCNTADVLELIGSEGEQRSAIEEAIGIQHGPREMESTAECRLKRLRADIRGGHLDDLNRQTTELIHALGDTADPALLAEAWVVAAELALKEGRVADAAKALKEAREHLAKAPDANEVRWEADVTQAQLSAKANGRLSVESDSLLQQDQRQSARLHNRPWQLRLQLARAQLVFLHDRPRGQLLLQQVSADAHAIHAEGLVQVAQADLRGKNAT